MYGSIAAASKIDGVVDPIRLAQLGIFLFFLSRP